MGFGRGSANAIGIVTAFTQPFYPEWVVQTDVLAGELNMEAGIGLKPLDYSMSAALRTIPSANRLSPSHPLLITQYRHPAEASLFLCKLELKTP
jgi:hypothetical protein